MTRKTSARSEADLAGALGLLGRELANDHRDEDDVVDAEDDLHRGQRDQAGPYGGIGKECKHLRYLL